MKYDIEADWILLHSCNFSCDYCFPSINRSNKKTKTYGSPAEWREGFDRTGKTWLLHISGGEPSIHPEFVELCLQLTKNHYISINSNISHSSIENFAKKVNPARVHFINAAIHLEERKKKAPVDTFIARIHLLKQAHFKVFVSLVMTPDVIDNFAEISEFFKRQGLFVIPKVMRANYKGQVFPKEYSAVQKDSIRDYLEEAKQSYQTILDQMKEPPTINMFSDYQIYIEKSKNYQGRLCQAGAKFVKITPNGTIVRCESTQAYGNILLNNLKLMDKPEVCNTIYCPYFCEKYSISSGQEE